MSETYYKAWKAAEREAEWLEAELAREKARSKAMEEKREQHWLKRCEAEAEVRRLREALGHVVSHGRLFVTCDGCKAAREALALLAEEKP